MLARFGYPCPATGFAFDVGRTMLAMEAQKVPVPIPGPDFFIIDFTADKTVALALSRRFRDLGAAVARDIITRGLEESIAYARAERARWALVVGSPGNGSDELLALDLESGGERTLSVAALLDRPEAHFPVFRGGARA
jgi:ATP phosphoribosyltransferase regulatory subunit